MNAPAPLIFLHGWGLHGGIWAETVQSLNLGPRALHTPDLPGYGQRPAPTSYSAVALADALASSLSGPVILCGWSMGGMVAQALAARHPDRVEALILVGSSPTFVNRADWQNGMAPDVLAGFAASLALDYKATLLRFLSLQARGGDAAREVIARLRERVFSQGEPDPATLAAGLELLREVDLRGHSAHIQCPTLILHGARDMLCPVRAAEWQAASMPNARLALHPHAAHAPFLSHPDWFTRQIEDFVHARQP